jgi:DNA-binding NtrC family response regulator
MDEKQNGSNPHLIPTDFRPSQASENSLWVEPLNVLVVDDERPILRTLSTFVTLQGYRCETQVDASVALGRMEDEIFHVVFADLLMPQMDGLEFIRRIKESGATPEIVVITAFSTLARAIEAYCLGVSDYLLKPFESLQQVGEVLTRAESRYLRWRKAIVHTIRTGGSV